LFDLEAHFDSLKHLLAGCDTWADVDFPAPSIIYDRFNKWTWAVWRVEIVFRDGCKLIALESYAKRKDKELRKLKYRFTDPEGKLIAQIDNHEKLVPFSEIPHLHLPDYKDRIYDGDPHLKGHSLKEYDFRMVWVLVQKYIDGGGLPWQ
jgi:hypothetical protein